MLLEHGWAMPGCPDVALAWDDADPGCDVGGQAVVGGEDWGFLERVRLLPSF